MWISARTATTFGIAVLALALLGVASPLLPRPHLPLLPEERTAAKFGAAGAPLANPERTRVQRMIPGEAAAKDGARWAATGRMGAGPALAPSAESIRRLQALLRDPRTVADPRAQGAEPTLVVRLLRDDERADVMLDLVHDHLVLALDGLPVGTYSVAALHREYAALAQSLLP